MKRRNTDAVSPVVGVMLMLVVTIIIAAVVSAFAGGLASDTSKAPQASLSVVAVIKDIQDTNKTNWDPNYPDDFTAKNGLLFEHMGGDAFALSDISIQLQSRDAKYTISTYDKIPTTNCLPNDVESYIMEIGDSDGFITPGDKFMLYADNCRIDDHSGFNNAAQISWKPEGAAGGMGLYLNTKAEYKVINKASGKVIQSGTVVLV
ncbi:MAG TPA: type IV pilin N-terminal domain-containing protein [Methanoregulaceae archaeon]|nr:MAG: type IV pilin N-terminal domain-containing protein [Methanolinea sp.]HON81231.1 type IV pilin N-terminal domain-containing protein [Methanoregulaceae archaeon]HPD10164.1 type IV pilin N-terminal domain-containing protein [Methanoregulaceae archaeon]HRT15169.1 type IV pilin N-terminal domain-containing protein [Methanoregulaceae archaeon]HRU30714.1 type IV pilin N-terminal domain-containing protein [Methanoregulaceae archaeon]